LAQAKRGRKENGNGKGKKRERKGRVETRRKETWKEENTERRKEGRKGTPAVRGSITGNFSRARRSHVEVDFQCCSRDIPVQNIQSARIFPIQNIPARNIQSVGIFPVQNIHSVSKDISSTKIQSVGIFQYKTFSQ
jgi:hypothetical protein